MFIKTKDIINMPIEKIQSMFNKFSSYTNSKTLSRQEEKEFSEQALSFMNAMKKCGDGHLISPEMKPIVDKFEKADYDITKLPTSLKVSFEKTYTDFKQLANNHREFKDTGVTLYCKIFEFFSHKPNLKFIQEMKNDGFFKKAFSKENYTIDDLQSIEMYLQDDRSIETEFTSAIKIFGHTVKTSGEVGIKLNLPVMVKVIIAVIIIALISALITLIILNIKYKSEVSKALAAISENDVKEQGAENIRKTTSYTAAKNMWEKTSPLTKNTCYKPMDFVITSLQNTMNNGYGYFKNITNRLGKAKNSKESYEYSQEFLLGGGFAIPVIVSFVLLIIMLKPIVYWIYNLRMKTSVFFEEEATLIEINIEDLVEMQNKATTDKEKERIGKIIEKQRKAMINMSSLSNFFYKQTNDAALKARDDIRDNDAVDYGAIVEETPVETPVDPVGDGPVEVSSATDPNTPYEVPQQDIPSTGTSVVLF